jgi:acetate kinase
MRVLILNSGSSSLKFRAVDVVDPANATEPKRRAPLAGAVEGIGGTAALRMNHEGVSSPEQQWTVPDHAVAVDWLFRTASLDGIQAIGHRIVHGGERFDRSIVLDADALTEIERLSELAPLHIPACLATIRASRAQVGPHVPMVGVFDTAFHRTLPERARRYAIPDDLADRHAVRRYGFHGIAHASLAAGYVRSAGRSLHDARLITLHLGSGCSITAISEGRSVDTSMGFTPLEGLVMGTRCGDIDPSVVPYLARREGVSPEVIGQWLNQRSGLLGVSGLSGDMRVLLAAKSRGESRAERAIELFCYRARKYIGAYLAALGGADAVVFGGGIGERAPAIRASICEGMAWCGLALDLDRNAKAVDLLPGTGARISRDDASLAAYVIAADEETWIAQETVRCLHAAGHA